MQNPAGGFVFPASPEQFEYMFQIVENCSSHGKKVACLFLSYGKLRYHPPCRLTNNTSDLAPGVVYPRQLQQAAFLLNHVLTTLSISPCNILLTGYSAGANLALALLSHISHPHPSSTIPIPPIFLSTPLAGVILVSPWVSFSTSSPSFTTNAYKDLIGPEACKQWSTAFMHTPWPHITNTDPYNQPITASESWWESLRVEKVVIVAGRDEVFIDDVRVLETMLRRQVGEGKVESAYCEGEFHDQPNVDLQLGFKESQQGEMAKVVKRWVNDML
jgi:acetyl esterase/lipase